MIARTCGCNVQLANSRSDYRAGSAARVKLVCMRAGKSGTKESRKDAKKESKKESKKDSKKADKRDSKSDKKDSKSDRCLRKVVQRLARTNPALASPRSLCLGSDRSALAAPGCLTDPAPQCRSMCIGDDK